MGGHKLIENGFLLMKKFFLTISCFYVYYEFYDDIKKVNDYNRLKKIQIFYNVWY